MTRYPRAYRIFLGVLIILAVVGVVVRGISG